MSEQLKTISVVVIAAGVIILLFMEFGGGSSDTVEERVAPALPDHLQPKVTDPSKSPDDLAAEGGSTITFDNTIAALGDVRKGEKKTVQFKFTNSGNMPLAIGDISGDFGVNVVSYSQGNIEPGKSGSITVDMVTDNLENGPQEKIVHVNSNANPKHIHLTVSANIFDK
jgi:hypothetical protein